MVKLLLKHSPDINACDYFGKTALTYAIEENNLKMAITLLLHRADPWHDKCSNYQEICQSSSMEKIIKKIRRFWTGLALTKNEEKRQMMWKKLKKWLKNLEDFSLKVMCV